LANLRSYTRNTTVSIASSRGVPASPPPAPPAAPRRCSGRPERSRRAEIALRSFSFAVAASSTSFARLTSRHAPAKLIRLSRIAGHELATMNRSDRFQAIESAGYAGRRAGGHAPRTRESGRMSINNSADEPPVAVTALLRADRRKHPKNCPFKEFEERRVLSAVHFTASGTAAAWNRAQPTMR
jgi:hypothetical protein